MSGNFPVDGENVKLAADGSGYVVKTVPMGFYLTNGKVTYSQGRKVPGNGRTVGPGKPWQLLEYKKESPEGIKNQYQKAKSDISTKREQVQTELDNTPESFGGGNQQRDKLKQSLKELDEQEQKLDYDHHPQLQEALKKQKEGPQPVEINVTDLEDEDAEAIEHYLDHGVKTPEESQHLYELLVKAGQQARASELGASGGEGAEGDAQAEAKAEQLNEGDHADVKVNGQLVRLTGKALEDYKKLEADYNIRKANNEIKESDTPSTVEYKKKQQKGLAMERAAALRKLTGMMTVKEKAKKLAEHNKLVAGREFIHTDDKGNKQKVEAVKNPAFGKITVKLGNGETASVPTSSLYPAEPAPDLNALPEGVMRITPPANTVTSDASQGADEDGIVDLEPEAGTSGGDSATGGVDDYTGDDLEGSSAEEASPDDPDAGTEQTGEVPLGDPNEVITEEEDYDVEASNLINGNINGGLTNSLGLTGVGDFAALRDELIKKYGIAHVNRAEKQYIHSRLGMHLAQKGFRANSYKDYLELLTQTASNGVDDNEHWVMMGDAVRVFQDMGFDRASSIHNAHGMLARLSDDYVQDTILSFAGTFDGQGFDLGVAYNEHAYGKDTKYDTDTIIETPGPKVVTPKNLKVDLLYPPSQKYEGQAIQALTEGVNQPELSAPEKLALVGSLIDYENDRPVVRMGKIPGILRHMMYKGMQKAPVDSDTANKLYMEAAGMISNISKNSFDMLGAGFTMNEAYDNLLKSMTTFEQADSHSVKSLQLAILQTAYLKYTENRQKSDPDWTFDQITDEELDAFKGSLKQEYNVGEALHRVMGASAADALLFTAENIKDKPEFYKRTGVFFENGIDSPSDLEKLKLARFDTSNKHELHTGEETSQEEVEEVEESNEVREGSDNQSGEQEDPTAPTDPSDSPEPTELSDPDEPEDLEGPSGDEGEGGGVQETPSEPTTPEPEHTPALGLSFDGGGELDDDALIDLMGNPDPNKLINVRGPDGNLLYGINPFVDGADGRFVIYGEDGKPASDTGLTEDYKKLLREAIGEAVFDGNPEFLNKQLDFIREALANDALTTPDDPPEVTDDPTAEGKTDVHDGVDDAEEGIEDLEDEPLTPDNAVDKILGGDEEEAALPVEEPTSEEVGDGQTAEVDGEEAAEVIPPQNNHDKAVAQLNNLSSRLGDLHAEWDSLKSEREVNAYELLEKRKNEEISHEEYLAAIKELDAEINSKKTAVKDQIEDVQFEEAKYVAARSHFENNPDSTSFTFNGTQYEIGEDGELIEVHQPELFGEDEGEQDLIYDVPDDVPESTDTLVGTEGGAENIEWTDEELKGDEPEDILDLLDDDDVSNLDPVEPEPEDGEAGMLDGMDDDVPDPADMHEAMEDKIFEEAVQEKLQKGVFNKDEASDFEGADLNGVPISSLREKIGEIPDYGQPDNPQIAQYFSGRQDVEGIDPDDGNNIVASGIVIIEPDGRMWIRKVTGAYNGTEHSFAKGQVEDGLSIQQNALKEVYEELGIEAEITGHLMDRPSQKKGDVRFYVGRRIGGNPGEAGWETEYAHLTNPEQANEFLNKRYDQDVAKKVQEFLASQGQEPTQQPEGVEAEAQSEVATAENILGGKSLGKQSGSGSNKGGEYIGKDGVKRYVKFYNDPEQSRSEHVASGVYNDLGIGAPNSHLFEHEGNIAYASDFIEGQQLAEVLKQTTLTKELADQILDGFAADILVANWDVLGLDKDNVLVTADGKVARIDNGGSFTRKAMAVNGNKPAKFLHEITEWEGFAPGGINTNYGKLFEAAGYNTPEDMGQKLIDQIDKITALKDQHGSWLNYLEQKYGDSVPKEELITMSAMMESRHQKMLEKVEPLRQDSSQSEQSQLGADDIMAEEVGGQKGGNKGGFYKGKDGQVRYVKVYGDDVKATGEHVSNAVYNALGLQAPNSHLFEIDGQLGYASDVVDDIKELIHFVDKDKSGDKSKDRIPKEIAEKVLEGVVADMMLMNWDAVGSGITTPWDNAAVDANGNIIRLDQGGSLFKRGVQGDKDPAAFETLSEWENFMKKNPVYSAVFSSAGLNGPEDMKDSIIQQMKDLRSLHEHHGDWESFLENALGQEALDPETKKTFADLLEKRYGLVMTKLAELTGGDDGTDGTDGSGGGTDGPDGGEPKPDLNPQQLVDNHAPNQSPLVQGMLKNTITGIKLDISGGNPNDYTDPSVLSAMLLNLDTNLGAAKGVVDTKAFLTDVLDSLGVEHAMSSGVEPASGDDAAPVIYGGKDHGAAGKKSLDDVLDSMGMPKDGKVAEWARTYLENWPKALAEASTTEEKEKLAGYAFDGMSALATEYQDMAAEEGIALSSDSAKELVSHLLESIGVDPKSGALLENGNEDDAAEVTESIPDATGDMHDDADDNSNDPFARTYNGMTWKEISEVAAETYGGAENPEFGEQVVRAAAEGIMADLLPNLQDNSGKVAHYIQKAKELAEDWANNTGEVPESFKPATLVQAVYNAVGLADTFQEFIEQNPGMADSKGSESDEDELELIDEDSDGITPTGDADNANGYSVDSFLNNYQTENQEFNDVVGVVVGELDSMLADGTLGEEDLKAALNELQGHVNALGVAGFSPHLLLGDWFQQNGITSLYGLGGTPAVPEDSTPTEANNTPQYNFTPVDLKDVKSWVSEYTDDEDLAKELEAFALDISEQLNQYDGELFDNTREEFKQYIQEMLEETGYEDKVSPEKFIQDLVGEFGKKEVVNAEESVAEDGSVLPEGEEKSDTSAAAVHEGLRTGNDDFDNYLEGIIEDVYNMASGGEYGHEDMAKYAAGYLADKANELGMDFNANFAAGHIAQEALKNHGVEAGTVGENDQQDDQQDDLSEKAAYEHEAVFDGLKTGNKDFDESLKQKVWDAYEHVFTNTEDGFASDDVKGQLANELAALAQQHGVSFDAKNNADYIYDSAMEKYHAKNQEPAAENNQSGEVVTGNGTPKQSQQEQQQVYEHYNQMLLDMQANIISGASPQFSIGRDGSSYAKNVSDKTMSQNKFVALRDFLDAAIKTGELPAVPMEKLLKSDEPSIASVMGALYRASKPDGVSLKDVSGIGSATKKLTEEVVNALEHATGTSIGSELQRLVDKTVVNSYLSALAKENYTVLQSIAGNNLRMENDYNVLASMIEFNNKFGFGYDNDIIQTVMGMYNDASKKYGQYDIMNKKKMPNPQQSQHDAINAVFNGEKVDSSDPDIAAILTGKTGADKSINTYVAKGTFESFFPMEQLAEVGWSGVTHPHDAAVMLRHQAMQYNNGNLNTSKPEEVDHSGVMSDKLHQHMTSYQGSANAFNRFFWQAANRGHDFSPFFELLPEASSISHDDPRLQDIADSYNKTMGTHYISSENVRNNLKKSATMALVGEAMPTPTDMIAFRGTDHDQAMALLNAVISDKGIKLSGGIDNIISTINNAVEGGMDLQAAFANHVGTTVTPKTGSAAKHFGDGTQLTFLMPKGTPGVYTQAWTHDGGNPDFREEQEFIMNPSLPLRIAKVGKTSKGRLHLFLEVDPHGTGGKKVSEGGVPTAKKTYTIPSDPQERKAYQLKHMKKVGKGVYRYHEGYQFTDRGAGYGSKRWEIHDSQGKLSGYAGSRFAAANWVDKRLPKA